MEKLIKDIKEESWRALKTDATRHKLKIGAFIDYLIKEHLRIERKKSEAWNYILTKRRRLSDKEAEAIKSSIHVFEQDYGFES